MDVITLSLIVGAATALILGAIVLAVKLKANKENKEDEKGGKHEK